HVLASIDFSKRDIGLWGPGTDSLEVRPSFPAAPDAADTRTVSLTHLTYEASWNRRRSVPTPAASSQLALEERKRRGGNHRVLLAGESQGAWIIGEAMADPHVGSVVDRAALLGHPWLAAHQYADSQDSRVKVVNHD